MPVSYLPRIVTVGRHRIGRVLERLVRDCAGEARFAHLALTFDEAVHAVRQMHALEPVDAIVAAGASGAWLRQRVPVPVAMVEVRGFDLMRALAQARALSPRVGLVTFEGPSPHLEQLDALFGMGIAQFSYHGPADAPACVQALRAAGIEAVVAPGLVCDLAEQAGIASVLLYSDDAVRRALQDGLRLAGYHRAERARRQRLDTILSQLQDGVVAVDTQQRIEALNPAMAALLGASAPEPLRGRRLSALAAPLDLAATLRLNAVDEDVVQLGTRTLAVRRAPIVENGEVTGALLVCRDPAAIQRADHRLRASQRHHGAAARYTLADFGGVSPAAVRLRALAQQCAASEATVLIQGESGSGKELVAQGIHTAGARAAHPFLAVNCAALSDSLLESELFGHEEGAFTGARRGGKPGLVEAAHTGTLFLDEIGDMPLALQTRLLRVLQEREVLRVGATRPVPVDVRVIAATHADLAALVREGRFRQDLYYRLAVLRLVVPPLRERVQDLAGLAQHILARRATQAGAAQSACQPLLACVLEWAHGYAWPGNVRELENWVERLLACRDYVAPGGLVDAQRLAELFPECARALPAPDAAARPLRHAGRVAELQHIQEVLDAVQGDQRQACERLGISRATLWRRLRGAPSFD